MLSILELYCGWTVFWITYFTMSKIFPKDNVIIRPKYNNYISDETVMRRLIINCLASGVIVPIISYIPQVIFLPDTLGGSIIRFALFPLISETWFYYMHRLMHTSYFYKWHADHHAFIRSHALAGLYCSVIEMLIVNQMSIAIPFQILGLSFNQIIFANILVALNVLKAHACLYSRNDIPWFIPRAVVSALDHDTHHYSLTCNYGILYLLDRIHGTYRTI